MLDMMKNLYKKISHFKKNKLRGKWLVVFILSYFAILSVVMITHNMWLSPDQFIIIGFVLALFIAQPIIFLRDWTPFVVLFLSYEFLRGFAPMLGIKTHIFPMIKADKMILGDLPTISLQNHLYTPGSLHFYDYISTVLYMLHFALPLIFGFFLWIYRRKEYHKFAITLLVLSYLSFLTYALFPAMPPWMASDQGIIPKVHDVFGTTYSTFVHGTNLPSAYAFMNYNPVAAMPSLHAAYPFLVYLFMVRLFGKWGHLFLIYVAAVTFAIVYTGNHYLIDAIIGFIYAYISFRGVEYLWEKFSKILKARQKLQTVPVETS